MLNRLSTNCSTLFNNINPTNVKALSLTFLASAFTCVDAAQDEKKYIKYREDAPLAGYLFYLPFLYVAYQLIAAMQDPAEPVQRGYRR